MVAPKSPWIGDDCKNCGHALYLQDYGQPTQHWEHWNRFYKAHSWPWSSEKCSECNCTKPEPKTNVDETIKKEEP